MNTTTISPFHTPDVVYKERKVYVAIDSRYRDRTAYPNENYFTVEFPTCFRNVMSIELVYASYDKIGTERFVNLRIPELDTFVVSNNNAIEGSFTQLPLIYPVNEYYADKFRSIREFNPPIAKLGRLTFSIVSESGEAYMWRDYFMRFEFVVATPNA